MGERANMNGNADKNDALVKVTEAANMLCVSPRTVWRMVAEGQLTPVRFRRCTRLFLSQVSSYQHGGGKVGGV
jgi:excisionase family DNA binding protein